MALTLHELIEQLHDIEAENGGDLPVIDDNENAIGGVEYNEDGGSPAVVLVMD